ncbi:MAG TPA: hypothetical protein PLP17_07735 [Oligoflexia bacterium]|nr:hypothetical protein [Oligoflexia bacterium]
MAELALEPARRAGNTSQPAEVPPDTQSVQTPDTARAARTLEQLAYRCQDWLTRAERNPQSDTDRFFARQAPRILRIENGYVTVELPRILTGKDNSARVLGGERPTLRGEDLRQIKPLLDELYKACEGKSAAQLPPPVLLTPGEGVTFPEAYLVFPCYDAKNKRFDGIIVVRGDELDPLRQSAYAQMYQRRTEQNSRTIEVGRWEDIYYSEGGGAQKKTTIMVGPVNGDVFEAGKSGYYRLSLLGDAKRIDEIVTAQRAHLSKQEAVYAAYVNELNSYNSSTIRTMLPLPFDYFMPPKAVAQPDTNVNWCTLRTIYNPREGINVPRWDYIPQTKWRLNTGGVSLPFRE